MLRSKMLVIFLAISILHAVSGFIFDEKKKPIANVAIISGSSFTTSNSKGYFNLKNSSDSLQFHRAGYQDTVVVATDFKRKIVLKKKDYQIPNFVVSDKKESLNYKLKGNKKVIKIKENNSNKSTEMIIKDELALDTSLNNLSGETQTIKLMGMSDKNTIVMLDGIPLNNNGQAFDLSQIPTEIIDHIEIKQNSGSTDAGSGAMGGVIHIVSKSSISDNSANNAEVNIEFGSFGKEKQSIQLTQNEHNMSNSLVIKKEYARNNFDFINSITNENHERNKNKFASTSITLNSNYFKNNFKFKNRILINDFEKHLPGPTNQSHIFNKSYIKDIKTDVSSSLIYSNNDYQYSFTLYGFRDRSRYDNSETTFFLWRELGRTEYDRIGLKADYGINVSDIDISLKTGFKEDRFAYVDLLTGNKSNPSMFQDSYFISKHSAWEKQINKSKIKLAASYRADFYERDDKTKSEHSWSVDSDISFDFLIKPTLRGNISKGFTLPSFYDLYWIGDSQTMGNPDLKPEHSNAYNYGLELNYESFMISADYHHADIEDMIFWHRSTNGWKPDNISDAQYANLELKSKLTFFNSLTLSGIYVKNQCYDKTEDGDFYDKFLMNVPFHIINTGISYKHELFYISAKYSKTGKRYKTRDHFSGTLPEFELIDATGKLFFKISDLDFTYYANFYNLLDKQYEEFSMMPKPGFNWSSGLQIKF
jgi:outer membrane cobalamin receptor